MHEVYIIIYTAEPLYKQATPSPRDYFYIQATLQILQFCLFCVHARNQAGPVFHPPKCGQVLLYSQKRHCILAQTMLWTIHFDVKTVKEGWYKPQYEFKRSSANYKAIKSLWPARQAYCLAGDCVPYIGKFLHTASKFLQGI